jgi:protein-S-isoprenylcysteine O-methyltransferase Ste14
MDTLIFKIVLTALFVSCFGSFTWGVRKFFVKPEKLGFGVRLTLAAGTLFSIAHLAVILLTSQFHPAAVAAAVVLYGLSLVMFWWAIQANRVKPLAACFAKSESLHLVQHGPYRLVRHPFYCSYLLAWIAGPVGTWNIWLAFTAAIMFVLYLTAAVNEENKFAASSLAEDYASYRATTGRFFPKLFKFRTHGHPH